MTIIIMKRKDIANTIQLLCFAHLWLLTLFTLDVNLVWTFESNFDGGCERQHVSCHAWRKWMCRKIVSWFGLRFLHVHCDEFNLLAFDIWHDTSCQCIICRLISYHLYTFIYKTYTVHTSSVFLLCCGVDK